MTSFITNRFFVSQPLTDSETKPLHRRHPNRRNLENLDFSHLFAEK